MTTTRLAAYAKLNLSLAIVRCRPDGYHEIESLIQTVDLADTIELSVSDGVGIHVENSLRDIQGPDLAERAAAALLAAKGVRRRVEINISKGIPAAAGLGGGSSDAAATLHALNRLTPQLLSNADLASIAATIGSDVPLFLVGGCVRASGRGEVVARLATSRPEHFVILVPPVRCSTASVYRAWEAQDSEGADLAPGRNDLCAPAISLHPELREVADAVARSGALYGGMSGSGSAFYAAYPDRSLASGAARRLSRQLPHCAVHVCSATDVGSAEIGGNAA